MNIEDTIGTGAGIASPTAATLASAHAERSTPRAWALRTEREAAPAGSGERFAGYGVVALAFAGGDVLAFRRVAASSIGAPYSAIWHRDRARAWTIYVTGDPALACPRYFGNAVARVVATSIEATWIGHDHLVVSAPGPRVEWSMRIHPTAATRVVGALSGLVPGGLWHDDRVLALAGRAGGAGLGAGPIPLAGIAPNGQRYRVRPRRLWRIDASAAQVEGRELGPLAAGASRDGSGARLAGAALFACGAWELERLDPARHSTRVGARVERP